jgi:hypothetical protein
MALTNVTEVAETVSGVKYDNRQTPVMVNLEEVSCIHYQQAVIENDRDTSQMDLVGTVAIVLNCGYPIHISMPCSIKDVSEAEDAHAAINEMRDHAIKVMDTLQEFANTDARKYAS